MSQDIYLSDNDLSDPQPLQPHIDKVSKDHILILFLGVQKKKYMFLKTHIFIAYIE